MKTEPIKELDNKYVGLFKKEDFDELPNKYHHWLSAIQFAIDDVRTAEGKEPFGKNRYVVLNLDDEIDVRYLIEQLKKKITVGYYETDSQVKDIAVDLVNAILKAKGG